MNRIYHYGNGTFFDQIKEHGELVAPITLCGIDNWHPNKPANGEVAWLHDESHVNCPECKRLLAMTASGQSL